MNPRIISFHYTLTNKSGEVIDASKKGKPLAYLEGVGQIIPGLESQMALLKKGDKKKIEVAAAEAYGHRIEQLVSKVPKTEFPTKTVKIGDRFRGGDEHDAPIFSVVSITEEEVILDGNHPLAGQDLIFDVEFVDSREATQEELSHGHAHGEHGHHH